MALFRRRTSARAAQAQAQAITAFWAWWAAEGARAAAAAIADREPERVAAGIHRHVDAIHPGLAWELAPGAESAHVLVVSPEGKPELRGVARRWRRAAPETDPVWSYSDARLPDPDARTGTLQLGDVVIDLASVTVGARVEGAAVHVAVHHPAFAAMRDEQRLQATFLLLDSALGEAAVETWVGRISATGEPSLDPVPLVGLVPVVQELQDRFTGPDGEPLWAQMEGLAPDGQRILASAQIPLRPAVAPHLDTYVGVVVPFADHADGGMPGEASLPALRDFEEHLGRRVSGSGRVVAHQTQSGVRVLHLYVDGTTPAVDQLRAAVGGWDQGRVKVEVAPDPAWERVRHLSG